MLLKSEGGRMIDFFGKMIKAGDTIELRKDGNDEDSVYFTGKVMLDDSFQLAVKRHRFHHFPDEIIMEQWVAPLHQLDASIIRVSALDSV